MVGHMPLEHGIGVRVPARQQMKRVIPVLALIVSVISVSFSWHGINVAEDSNRIANEAKKEANNLFLTEKRPYLNVYTPEIIDKKYLIISDATEPMATIKIELKNEGRIAAKNVGIVLHFFDEQGNSYNTVSIYVPMLQKILPDKSHFVEFSMSDKKDTPIYKAVRSGKINFQIEVAYKSDADKDILYSTKKQFAISSNNVVLIGNLGEFK